MSLNNSFQEEMPVEVVMFSKNSLESGLRACRSIKHYGLKISQACFSSGESNFQYLPAINASLFLSANEKDMQNEIKAGFAAGTVLNINVAPDDDKELRLGFDFDGVVADDSSETFYKSVNGNMTSYFQHEQELADNPLSVGPIGTLLQKISFFSEFRKEEGCLRLNI